MPDTIARRSFDYSNLDTQTAQFLQKQTVEIKGLYRQTIENIIRVGQKLLEVKARLPHGQWLSWLEAEFGWTDRTARNYMLAGETFKLETVSDLDIAARALYLLASPYTPEEAREEAISRAEAGEPISYTTAKSLRDKYIPPIIIAPELDLQPEPEVFPQDREEQPQAPTALPPQATQSPIQSLPLGASKQAIASPSQRKRAREYRTTIVAPKRATPGDWWKLGQNNYLYCGDPTAAEFQRLLPESIALAIAAAPSREACTKAVPPKATSSISVVTPYEADQDLRCLRAIIENALQLYTEGGDDIVLSFLPDPAILSLIEQLDCRFFCADPDPERCDSAITVWTTTGGTAEKMKTRQTGKKRLSSPALAK